MINTLAYVRDMYRVPAFVGCRVKAIGAPGEIVGGRNAYLQVHIDGDPKGHRRYFHPTYQIEYEVSPGEWWKA